MSAKTVTQKIVWHYGSKPPKGDKYYLFKHQSGFVDTAPGSWFGTFVKAVAWAHVRPVRLPKEMKP
jgi:hypothetical protein